jgi:hypothetical protein
MSSTNELRMWGHRARLIVELYDGEHDVSHLLKGTADVGGSGWLVNAEHLLRELDIEKRARTRADTMSAGVGEGRAGAR